MSNAPINLNKVRKARARDDAKQQADANAVKHGRTKAEHDLEAARRKQSAKRHEDHERDDE